MDTVEFLGLRATHNPHRWYLPVVPGISTGAPFLFGGCALGAAIEAMERTTGRPMIWATGQYLSYAHPPEIMDIDVTVATQGHHITQARAVGHVGDREIVTVNAALGSRPGDEFGRWPTFPDVRPPQECRPRERPWVDDSSLFTRIDLRAADARDWDDLDGTPSGHGRSALWAKIPELSEVSAGALAILGDHVPFGISQALGVMGGGNSLDNTLRIVRLVPTEWVLLDVRIDAVADGFGTGTVLLWSEDGGLLATASQSTIVRHWAPPDPSSVPGATGSTDRSDDERN
ncbi:MAG: thioesterase family protein [Actinobacteria bacterium]|nr:thioesterase family protein [Actinomycetota bacterium]